MKRWTRVTDLIVTLAVIPLIVGVLPVILPAPVLPTVFGGLLCVVGPYLFWRLLAVFPELQFGRLRGVVAVASDRGRRQGEFSEPWLDAHKEVVAWGVGMTNLARDEGVITKGLQRNLSAKLEIVDAAWIRDHPDIAEQIDAMYGRPRFVEQIEDSTAQLVAMARKLNKKFGDDRVQIWAVQAFVPQSGTVADPDTDQAWGWVEWHNYGFPHGQTRLKLRCYPHRSPLNPPLLRHVLASRENLPRRRLDKGGRKPPRTLSAKDIHTDS